MEKFETGFDHDAWKAYSEAVDDEFEEILDRFADGLEAWLRSVHEKAPIAFFCGPNGADSDWHDWSVAQLGDLAYPMIQAYEEAGPDRRLVDDKTTDEFIMKHVDWCRTVVQSHAA